MTYHSELVEHYKAVKSRLNGTNPKPVDKPVIEPQLPVDNSKIIQESPEVIEFAQEISVALLYKMIYDNTQPVKRKLWKEVVADVERNTSFQFIDLISLRVPKTCVRHGIIVYWKLHKDLNWISIAEIGRRCGKITQLCFTA